MKTLLKGIQVIYPGSDWNEQKVNILVTDGVIEAISAESLTEEGVEVIEAQDLLCMPALVDVQCAAGEPGHEYKEDLQSLLQAAHAGGFSDVFVLPNTEPAIDTQAQVRYVREQNPHQRARAHAYGAISKNIAGKELSEMYDMHKAGAIAFSDGKKPLADVNMMKRALDYARGFGAVVCSFPYDERINPGGYAHEGPVSTRLGLKSSPALAEEVMVNRDLALLEYTGSKLHISSISSAASLPSVKAAREKGLDLSCAVALPSLLFTDDDLTSFDTHFKTLPALRDAHHRDALIQGLKDGVIDMICTDHSPENIENKAVEMDNAAFGMTMLEVAFAKAYEALNDQLGTAKLVELMSLNPRKRFQLEAPRLEASAPFNFAVFAPNESWTYDRGNVKSKSHNSPYFGASIQGKMIGIGA